jgi:hypothetical protein
MVSIRSLIGHLTALALTSFATSVYANDHEVVPSNPILVAQASPRAGSQRLQQKDPMSWKDILDRAGPPSTTPENPPAFVPAIPREEEPTADELPIHTVPKRESEIIVALAYLSVVTQHCDINVRNLSFKELLEPHLPNYSDFARYGKYEGDLVVKTYEATEKFLRKELNCDEMLITVQHYFPRALDAKGDNTVTSRRTYANGIELRVVNIKYNDVLNIRKEATDESKIVGIIPPDTAEITYLGQTDGEWMFVRYGSAAGWVKRNFVAPVNSVASPNTRPP